MRPLRSPGKTSPQTVNAERSAPRSRIILLTGPSRAGKTTVCRKVVTSARSRGLSVAGVMTEDGATPAGLPLQIAHDLSSGEQRLLARANPPGDRRLASPPPDASPGRGSTPQLRWAFAPDGVAFGRRAIERAMKDGCNLLVIDQIGPLELLQGRGWTIALDALNRLRFDLGLVVVNPKVVGHVQSRLCACDVLEVRGDTRDALPAAIMAAYLPTG